MAKIVTIGASQGGIPALRTLLSGLAPGFAASVLVVQHIGAAESALPAVLGGIGMLEVTFGAHREPLVPGHVYVAPPDHHMLVNGERIELTRGPRENWARPAIDPLFRSAAHYHGPEAIGIVLSGRLNDGTAGLFEIKRGGGVAKAPDMPQSALEHVSVDYCLPVAEMPRLLNRLLSETGRHTIPFFPGEKEMAQEQFISKPTAQTCPECGGAMRQENVGNVTRFGCHIGHVMTAEVLAATQLEEMENSISAVLRTLNERVALCRSLADKHAASGNDRAAGEWRQAAEEAERREKLAQELVDADWKHPEARAEAAQ
jgi:two-component system chemotaxis response regulator CheB